MQLYIISGYCIIRGFYIGVSDCNLSNLSGISKKSSWYLECRQWRSTGDPHTANKLIRITLAALYTLVVFFFKCNDLKVSKTLIKNIPNVKS